MEIISLYEILKVIFTIVKKLWWRMTGSNRRPSACKADALPAELILHMHKSYFSLARKESYFSLARKESYFRWCEKTLVTPTGFEPVLPP